MNADSEIDPNYVADRRFYADLLSDLDRVRRALTKGQYASRLLDCTILKITNRLETEVHRPVHKIINLPQRRGDFRPVDALTSVGMLQHQHNSASIKIYTLGRFSIVVNGKTLRFYGKSRQMPLNFVKVLIALGGRDVSRQQIQDLLWPDADGDQAEQVFNVTLHRTRKLIGKQGILLENGHVSLNDKLCWLDNWEVEKKLNQLRHAISNQDSVSICDTCQYLLAQIIKCYKGSFLAHDTTDYLIAYRERLSSKFCSVVVKFSGILQQNGEYQIASELIRQAIEVEPYFEKFYTELMRCQIAMGNYSDAIAVFRVCSQIIFGKYKMKPSAATLALYDSIFEPQSMNGATAI